MPKHDLGWALDTVKAWRLCDHPPWQAEGAMKLGRVKTRNTGWSEEPLSFNYSPFQPEKLPCPGSNLPFSDAMPGWDWKTRLPWSLCTVCAMGWGFFFLLTNN